MAPRQSSQTGRREMLVRDAPQMRQSEGNSTAKRLAAAWLAQARGLCKTIEAPTSGTESRLARILSSLLLKTASLTLTLAPRPCGQISTRFGLRLQSSIAASLSLGNVTVVSRPRGDLGSGNHAADIRQAIAHLREDQTVIPPEAFRAAHRLHEKKRQNVAFGQGPAAGAESSITAAIAAVKFLEMLHKTGIGRVVDHVAPLGYANDEGRYPSGSILLQPSQEGRFRRGQTPHRIRLEFRFENRREGD